MKAAVWVDYGNLKVMDVPLPEPKPSEVLVRVKAASLCTTDAIMISRGILGLAPPQVIGHEVCGVVQEIGGEVNGLRVGDRVALDPPVPCRACGVCSAGLLHLCPNTKHIGAHTGGGLAEYLTIDHRNAHRVPEGVSDEEAALTEALAVCMEAFERGGEARAKRVAIFGDGPFGIVFCRLALLHGAACVLVVGHHERRLAKVRHGRVRTVDSRRESPVQAIREQSGGAGADLVFEAVGSARIQEEDCLDMLAARGTLVIFSHAGRKVTLDLDTLQMKEQRIVGSVRSLGLFPRALQLLSSRQVDLGDLITHRIRIEDVEEGFRLMREDKENTLKVVVTF